jgi:hypothetical protein
MRQISLLIIVTLLSCTTSVRHGDNVTTDEQKNDFETFVSLFNTRLTKIPDNYVKQFLQVDTIQFDTKNVWTYEAIKFSNEITGLVYKANCTAGGLCEKLTLVTFDKLGRRITEFEVGHNYSDYGSSSELTYTIKQDRLELKLNENEVLEADDGTDKEQVTVDTTFVYKVNTTTGQIGKD